MQILTEVFLFQNHFRSHINIYQEITCLNKGYLHPDILPDTASPHTNFVLVAFLADISLQNLQLRLVVSGWAD